MSITAKINPAILVNNLTDFAKQIRSAEGYTDEVDIDIIDWQRTPDKTISVLDALSIETALKLNFDLMLDYPTPAVDQLLLNKTAQIARIILNIGTRDELLPLMQKIKNAGKQVGLSLNPNNVALDAQPYFDVVDLIQVYTVEPGSQGNPFLPERLKLITELKQMGFKGKLEIDGGFNETNADLVKTLPLDFISTGSALSKAEDPQAEYIKLTQMLHQ